MKRLGIIILILGLHLDLFGQGIPTVLQKYRHLAFFSPAMTGVNNYLDINVGHGVQPLASGASLNTTLFSAYYSTRSQAHGSNNSIRGTGTETMEDFYANRNQRSTLKMGFGTAIYTEKFGEFTKTYNSNSYAVHVPIANHTYLTMGLAAGFNSTKVDVFDLTLRELDDDVYNRFVASGGNNTNLHIDAGLGVTSNDYYFAIGVNNIANALISGDSDLNFDNPLISNAVGGYRFFHSHSFEAIAVTSVTLQSDVPSLWNVGLRGRINEVVIVGMNFTSNKTILAQLGFQLGDYINLGYTFSSTSGKSAVVSSHEFGLGIRFFNNNNYTPIW
ncbi:PorP/SprF family type IX secretion system membrane protein [Reichenbachiella sp. MALMAid0571]|uniref:PorP/SprF family type IX secretion system membrane protein n=1 Tax=Reichenbachiella sp. MALMAid0571 TaxID=3143939 RepID=UPI0032DF6F09